jgi:hypothetical protein
MLTILMSSTIEAQSVYTITADSVKLTSCDSSELIILNHTQNVPGFLFNTGNGRTIFKHALQPIGTGSWLLGSDTLNLNTNAWLQGGNSFGTTGVLGTLDNNNLDLYTDDSLRARLVPRGRLLLGTTTDDSTDLLQVHGTSAFSGNVNIGSATITNGGSLIGTNAILQNQMIPETNIAWGKSLYISKLDNVLYDYQNRFDTYTSVDANGTQHLDIHFPPSEIQNGYAGITYGDGSFYLSFYYENVPASVSVMLKDSLTGTWFGPYSSSTNLSTTNFGFFRIDVAGLNFISELNFAMTPQPGGNIALTDVEYVLQRPEGLINLFPYVGKTGNEHMYGSLFFRSNGQDNILLSSQAPYASYFLNKVLIGSSSDNGVGADKLQVTGNIVASGNIGIGTSTPAAQLHTTGSVCFAGLTEDSLQNNVLVCDGNGFLYLRNASSLAAGNLVRSSLAVNGPIKAQQLTLAARNWPDYVFDSTYHLPRLTEVESYIHREHHLPGIPSAAAVQKDSLDVGASQTALLKKIEELTLYSIEQDKKIHSLEDEMGTLKKMMLDDRKNRKKTR